MIMIVIIVIMMMMMIVVIIRITRSGRVILAFAVSAGVGGLNCCYCYS